MRRLLVLALMLTAIPAIPAIAQPVGGGGGYGVPQCNGKDATIVDQSNDNNPRTIDNEYTGTTGNDVFVGGDGTDIFSGLGGNDTACMFGSSDAFYGQNGDDWADLGAANDSFEGQAGDDVAWMGDSHDYETQGNYPGYPGWAQYLTWGDIACTGGSDCFSENVGTDHDVMHGEDGPDVHTSLGPGNDKWYGGSGKDSAYGQNGLDDLYGGDGDDFMVGGQDYDEGFGGPGSDYCETEAKTSCQN